MVYLRGIMIKPTMALLILITFAVTISVEAATTKFAYKKPIYGKTINTIKEKPLKFKPEVTKATTTTTIATTSTTTSATTAVDINSAAILSTTAATVTVSAANTNPILVPEVVISSKTTANSNEAGTEAEAEMQPDNSLEEEKTEVAMDETVGEAVEDAEEEVWDVGNIEMITEEQRQQETEQVAAPVLDVPMDLESTTFTSTSAANETTTTTTERNGPVPCTCGVFLSSQIKRGSSEPPQSKPVIVNELERHFPCTAVGQKQCQTKCLETIVQHLPNSASILCATLNRDCRKERAYLFIKNCRNQWTNTNLAAGREYCCKNGQPYKCPMV